MRAVIGLLVKGGIVVAATTVLVVATLGAFVLEAGPRQKLVFQPLPPPSADLVALRDGTTFSQRWQGEPYVPPPPRAAGKMALAAPLAQPDEAVRRWVESLGK